MLERVWNIKVKRRYVLEVLIWILSILLFGILLGGLHFIYFVKNNAYTITFRDIDGIIKGSPIRMMGVSVGHVRKIVAYPEGIEVQFIITSKGIKIPNGSIAKVSLSGLAGSRSIEIMPPNSRTVDAPGIITKCPMRIKDIFEFGKSYYETLGAMQKEIEKMSEENLLIIISKVGKKYDFEPVDKAINKGVTVEGTFHKKLDGISRVENQVDKIIEKLPQK